MRIKFMAVLAFVLLTVACGGEDGGLASTLHLNDDPGSVRLMVRDEGGFVPPDFQIRQGPRVSLLRDGTLITQGAMMELFPGPLLTPYLLVKLDEDTMLFVLEELDAIGFVNIEEEINDEAAAFVADASTTMVTFYNQDGTHGFGVYGLGLGDTGPGSDFADTRVPQLANLVSQIEGASFSLSGEAYQPKAIQVMAGLSEFPAEPGFANVRAWPLPLPYDEMSPTNLTTWRCATFEGEEMDTLMAEFGQANQVTTWDADGTEYSMALRPLFPGEEACTPLFPAA
ncbi:MAG: hypothetical protein Q8Q52_02905 [Acidimicrobiia bacterium]|nr:hypothetical protein [Acidimicrobiia bacterium]